MLVNACHIAVCKWKGSAKFERSKLSSSKKKNQFRIVSAIPVLLLITYLHTTTILWSYIPTYHYNTMVRSRPPKLKFRYRGFIFDTSCKR